MHNVLVAHVHNVRSFLAPLQGDTKSERCKYVRYFAECLPMESGGQTPAKERIQFILFHSIVSCNHLEKIKCTNI